MEAVSEKVAALEAVQARMEEDLNMAKGDIFEIRKDLGGLVVEVRQIRNALYFMALVMAADVPWVRELLIAIVK